MSFDYNAPRWRRKRETILRRVDICAGIACGMGGAVKRRPCTTSSTRMNIQSLRITQTILLVCVRRATIKCIRKKQRMRGGMGYERPQRSPPSSDAPSGAVRDRRG